jgi:hypothetical protein
MSGIIPCQAVLWEAAGGKKTRPLILRNRRGKSEGAEILTHRGDTVFDPGVFFLLGQ